MRKHRVALIITIAAGVAAAVSIILPTSAPSQEATPSEYTALVASPAHPAPSTADQPIRALTADMAALRTLAAAEAAQAASEAQSAQSSSSTASPAPTAPTTTTTSAPAPSGADQLLADAPAYVVQAFNCIADDHESGGDPTAENPSSGDSGLYQFADTTWAANGGGQFASKAMYATVAEQDTVAYWTWEHDGFSPWNGDNACWE